MSNWNRILTLSYILWALILPWSLAGMQIALGLVVLLSLFHCIKNHKPPVAFHPFFVLIVIYLVTRVVSAMLSPNPRESLLDVFHTDWVLLTIPILVTTPISSDNRRNILRTLIISASVLSIYAILQFFIGVDLYRGRNLAPLGHFYRATGAYDFYLTFAGNQLMIFFLALAFTRFESRHQFKKLLYLATAVLILASVVSTFGRSAWVAAALVLGIGMLLSKRRPLIKALAIALVVLVILTLSFPELQDRLLSAFELSRNQDRLNLWKTALLMVKDHPLWGVGPGMFGTMFPMYRVPGHYGATGHAHNDYLYLAATSGLLSLVAWLLMWGAWFYYVIRGYRNPSLPNTERTILFGVILSVASILVAAFFQCYYTDLENNILWCFLTVMGLQIVSQTSKYDHPT